MGGLAASPAIAQTGYPDSYGSLVLDVRTGEILHAHRADAPHHQGAFIPLMSAHVIVQSAAHGAVGLFEPVPDAHSASGRRVILADVLFDLHGGAEENRARALAAAALVGGDEDGFVAHMNHAAAALAMGDTRYAAALPEPRALTTTVRDTARLALALARSTPDLLERIADPRHACPAIEAMICLAAVTEGEHSHLAALAERDGTPLIIVIFNAPGEAARDDQAETLLTTAWAMLHEKSRSHTVRAAAALAPAPGDEPTSSPLRASAQMGAATPPGPRFAIQVGAYRSPREAEAQLAAIVALNAGALTPARALASRTAHGGGYLWRARFVDLTLAQAQAACAALAEHDAPCLIAGRTGGGD